MTKKLNNLFSGLLYIIAFTGINVGMLFFMS